MYQSTLPKRESVYAFPTYIICLSGGSEWKLYHYETPLNGSEGMYQVERRVNDCMFCFISEFVCRKSNRKVSFTPVLSKIVFEAVV